MFFRSSLARKLKGISSEHAAGADMRYVSAYEEQAGFALPGGYKRVLERSNGMGFCSNHVRMLGIGTADACDVVWWNDHEYWKFAWEDKVVGFWCFAETSFGDQFAFLESDLKSGQCRVFQLDAWTMSSKPIANTFEEFVTEIFVPLVSGLKSSLLWMAVEKFGRIELDQSVIHRPPYLLSMPDAVETAELMGKRVVMTINGDVATQLKRNPGKKVCSFSAQADDQGRMRIQLKWE